MNLKNVSIAVVTLTVLGSSYFYFNENTNNRWYTKEQVSLGKNVFINNCASCHGTKAEKTVNWRETLLDGSYPPPPLNDKAHAWHHPKWQLMQIINQGGAPYDGKMPPFKDVLTKEEKESAIAYFQSFWADEFYTLWKDSRKGLEEKR